LNFTEQQLRQFEEEGYLFLPCCFSLQEAAMLRAEADAVYAMERDEVVREKSGVARTAFAAHTYNEAFRRLGAHPRLVEPAMQLLDGPVYMHQFKVNAKAAFDGDVWQWHQDYGTWARDDLMPEPRAMNIAVFIDDVTAANGPLLFIPGSHKQGVFDAGHDVETTSYPLWTLNRETVTKLAERGGCHRSWCTRARPIFRHSAAPSSICRSVTSTTISVNSSGPSGSPIAILRRSNRWRTIA
jgi:ectoine hydroxylase